MFSFCCFGMMSKAMHVPHGTLDKLAHFRWYHCAVHVFVAANLLSYSTYNYIMIHHYPLYRIRLQGLLSAKLYS